MRFFTFILRRGGRLLLTVWVIATGVFFLMRVLPGDPAAVIAGIDATEEDVAAIREGLGLEAPPLRQYAVWLADALRGDFGESMLSGRPALGTILERFPVTLALALPAFGLSLLIAVPFGVFSATRRWGVVDCAGMIYSQAGMAIPGFWLGIILLMVFSVRLGWFPLFGTGGVSNYVLPAAALGVGRSALLMRFVRSAMLDELGKEYVITAESLGLHLRSIRFRHALINALIPVITIAGIQFAGLLGGTIIIEQVFSLPGAGRVLLTAVQQRDFPVVQAGVVFVAVIVSGTNCLADLLYGVVNPRIRVG